jgi:outer membrane protein assembly factor BamB
MRRIFNLLAALLSIACLSIPAADWPQFRGESASGVGSGLNPPVQWDVVKGTNVLWKVEVPGLAISSPIVWGDRIYLTTAISSDKTQKFKTGLYGNTDSAADMSLHVWKVLAYDKRSGKLLWEQTAHQGVPKTKRHPKSSQASATPVTDGKVVVAYFGSEGLYAYSSEGKLLWSKDLGIQNAGWFFDPDSEWGVGSSPVIYRNTVIVQCDRHKDSFIAAFDLRNGKEVWRAARTEIPSWSTPTIVQSQTRTEIVTNATKATRGYDAGTGKELWTLGPNSEIACPTPVSGHGFIFVTSGYAPIQPIYAIKIGSNGDLTLKDDKESSDAVAWSKKVGGAYLPSPILYGDLLYLVNNNGILAAYDAKTGNRVYQQRIDTGGSYTASPVAAGGKLYFATEDGDIYVVKAGPQYELLAKNPMGEAMLATPAWADDMLIVRGERHLFAITEKK